MPQPAQGRGRVSARRRPSSAAASDRAPRSGQRSGGASRSNGRPGSGSGSGSGSGRSRPSSSGSGRPVPSSYAAQAALEAALTQAVSAPDPQLDSFAELGLPTVLIEGLRRQGLTRPFAIQSRALPDALAGRDVLGRAATGSGKTLAFGLPMLARLGRSGGSADGASERGAERGAERTAGAPRALVLVPTRELALQVAQALTPLAKPLGLRISTVVGGVGYGGQIDALARGVDLLIATPGRLVDLIERKVCRLDRIEITALDEADHMADLGFLPVVTQLLTMTPSDGQRLLFSATLDRAVAGVVEQFLTDPAVHAVTPPTAAITSMTHQTFVIHRDHKIEVAAEVAARPARTLFFVRTKHGADRLAKQLARTGVEAAALHGNLTQNARQRVLTGFTQGHSRVLVATDVAARGLHVDGVDLVVHFDPPTDHKDYVHRSGRTARAGNTGTVVSFVQPDQVASLRKMHQAVNVTAEVQQVAPGHTAVLALATSGEPIVVTSAPPGPAGSSGSSSSGRSGPGRSGPGRSRAGRSAAGRSGAGRSDSGRSDSGRSGAGRPSGSRSPYQPSRSNFSGASDFSSRSGGAGSSAGRRRRPSA